jgi:hypothetical protein
MEGLYCMSGQTKCANLDGRNFKIFFAYEKIDKHTRFGNVCMLSCC